MDMKPPTEQRILPYGWPDNMGCHGVYKTRPTDFLVEEIPAYEPSGNGEHLYLFVEKEGLTTEEVTSHFRKLMNLPAKAVGQAGLKDKQALTRQWISLHTPRDQIPAELETGSIRILQATRHGNKLRPGHLRGNRFEVVLRDVDIPPGFDDLVTQCVTRGFPNYFGAQRLGTAGRNAAMGRGLVRNGYRGGGGLNRVRFQTNAYQAALFNGLTATRLMQLGNLETLLEGDIAALHHSAGFFHVTPEDAAETNRRAKARELSPSAPLPGYKVPLAEGVPGTWERDLLLAEGVELAGFQARGKRYSPKGERRPVRAFPEELTWKRETLDGLPCAVLQFKLAAGVYATALLRELCKAEEPAFPFPEMIHPFQESVASHA